LNRRLNRGANRAAPSDLAERTERAGLLGGVQIHRPLVPELANPHDFVMVMEDFSRKEMEFASQEYAHHQGAHPTLVPKASPSSQLDGFFLI